VGRAVREVEIRMIPAYSPQARGRSERSFGTWQRRLPQELRLHKIGNLEAANVFLREHYIAEFNRHFQVAAAQRGNAFWACRRRDLDLVVKRIAETHAWLEVATFHLEGPSAEQQRTQVSWGSLTYAASDSSATKFELPGLPYAYDALEPSIDKQTMVLHHDMYHGPYVKNLRAALEKHVELFNKTPEGLLRDLNAVPEDIRAAVRNHGGGHVNHTMFWKIMKPQGGGEATGLIADVIKKTFGSFKDFQTRFNAAGAKQFGSGWVWLVANSTGELKIITTPNQDNPLSQGLFPILGNDVWEHAYYLKYNNRRPEYLAAWWNLVNWEEVNKRIAAFKSIAAKEDALEAAFANVSDVDRPSFSPAFKFPERHVVFRSGLEVEQRLNIISEIFTRMPLRPLSTVKLNFEELRPSLS
jgi:superoxide dismutase, Fe-Mn family